MKRLITFVLLAATICGSISMQAQVRRKTPARKSTSSQTTAPVVRQEIYEKDGHNWVQLRQGNLYGAEDDKGNRIIPIKYDTVGYNVPNLENVYAANNMPYYYVRKGKGKSAIMGGYTATGEYIVKVEKGYKSCTLYNEGGLVHWTVSKILPNGKTCAGILDAKGNVVIAPERGYKGCYVFHQPIGDYIQVKGEKAPNGEDYDGLCNMNGAELVAPDRYTAVIVYSDKVTLKTPDGQYSDKPIRIACTPRYDFTMAGVGAPQRNYMTDVRFDKEGFSYYSVWDGYGTGVLDINRNVLIPCDRGYSSAIFHPEEGHVGYFSVDFDGKKGACDLSGKEVVPPKYEIIIYSDGFEFEDGNGKWIPLNIFLNSRGIVEGGGSTASREGRTSSSSSKPSSSASSSSNSDGLLYSGIYTQSSQGRSLSTGRYTQAIGGDFTMEVKIYKDYILVLGSRYDFDRTSGARRVYSGPAFGGKYEYFVDSNYNMYLVMTQSNMFGTDSFHYDMSKGECTMPKNYNNDGGFNGGNSGGGNGGSVGGNNNHSGSGSTGTRSCRVCNGTGLCTTCNGKGRYLNTYLGNNTWKDCPNCTNGRCTSCGGTGRK